MGRLRSCEDCLHGATAMVCFGCHQCVVGGQCRCRLVSNGTGPQCRDTVCQIGNGFFQPVTPRHRLKCYVWPSRLGNSSIEFRVDGEQDGKLCFSTTTVSVFTKADEFVKRSAPDEFRQVIEQSSAVGDVEMGAVQFELMPNSPHSNALALCGRLPATLVWRDHG